MLVNTERLLFVVRKRDALNNGICLLPQVTCLNFRLWKSPKLKIKKCLIWYRVVTKIYSADF